MFYSYLELIVLFQADRNFLVSLVKYEAQMIQDSSHLRSINLDIYNLDEYYKIVIQIPAIMSGESGSSKGGACPLF